MKKRLIKDLKILFLILLFGSLYAILVIKKGIYIPCVFNKVTGLLCPACGATRMITNGLKGDFLTAFGYNKALFITLPIIVLILLRGEIGYIKNGRRSLLKTEKVVLWVLISGLLLFGIIRNII